MFEADSWGQWLLLAAVAYFAFMLGRATAGKRETPEERAMRRMNEEQAAEDAFASLSPAVQADIDRLLLDKKKIEAIKLIREHTGRGLKESKDAAEQRQNQIKG